ncbi:ras-related protein Rab-8A-like isoform X1 [Strongylocentrotus purpuratus]|uniref:Ras-related protein Rab-13 n=1 Tax=Strongylocentrotus purpuratus TaxID=7668 RepID=A0A7M7NXX9_STRPU|nr:ras-related protein Rab-8A-like isoform X1 [Strongylocentrotus purpuratus]
MARAYDFLYKIVVIGDPGVGKTCVIFRFSEDVFHTTFLSVIGIDFKFRTIELDGKKIKVQIWDTAGQERFKAINTTYYRGAQGIMVLYDITNQNSFVNMRKWIRESEEHGSADAEKMILGNKCDMDETRAVSQEKGEQLAKELGIKFFETSAKVAINVEEAFMTLVRDIKSKMDRNMDAKGQQKPEVIKVTKKNSHKKSCLNFCT